MKNKVEQQRAAALQYIQTKDPATDIPSLRQTLDCMKELVDVGCINLFMEGSPLKFYNGVIDNLQGKIRTLVEDTANAYLKQKLDGVTINREYFERVALHISHHIPEGGVDISAIVARFSKEHSDSTKVMRDNLPQYLENQKFQQIAVCLQNLQRTKDSVLDDQNLFDEFNEAITAHLVDLHRKADLTVGVSNPAEAISNLRDVLERCQKTLCLHTIQLTGRNVVEVFREVLKCCWDRFEKLEKRYWFNTCRICAFAHDRICAVLSLTSGRTNMSRLRNLLLCSRSVGFLTMC